MLTALLITSLLSAAPAAGVDSDLATMQQYSAEQLRELLRGLLPKRAGSSSLTQERVAAIKQLAATDEEAAAWLARFPAEVRVTVQGGKQMEEKALRGALVRVFRETGLPLVTSGEPARAVLQVHVAFEENRSAPPLFSETSMKSYSAISTGAFEALDGTPLARFANVDVMLGINLGFGAQKGADEVAGSLCDVIVRELALAIAGGLPVDGGGSSHDERDRDREQEVLDAARAKLTTLRERHTPAAGRIVDALPLGLSLVAGPAVSARLHAVFEGEVRRLLAEVGLPVAKGADARGGMRVAYDLTHFQRRGMHPLVLGAAISARSAAGETLVIGHASRTRLTYGSATVGFANDLRPFAIGLVQAIVDALDDGADERVAPDREREDWKPVLPVELRVLAAGFGDPVADEIVAAHVSATLRSALARARIPTAPSSLAKGRLVVRVVKRTRDDIDASISVPLAGGKKHDVQTTTQVILKPRFDSGEAVADDVAKAILEGR